MQDLTANLIDPVAGQEVIFTATEVAAGEAGAWTWSVTDDTRVRDAEPNAPFLHTFASPGTYTVTVTVDHDGSSSEQSLEINVGIDTTPPQLPLLRDVPRTVEAGVSGVEVEYVLPAATDDRDPSPDVSCEPFSGTRSPIGSTEVTCTASDFAGNEASRSFSVEVTREVDTTPPSVTLTAGGSPAEQQSLAPGDSLEVVGTASDPEGEVQRTGIWSSSGGRCRKGELGRTIGGGLIGKPAVSASEPMVSWTLTIPALDICGDGWILTSYSFGVWARAASEGGEASSGTISVGLAQ